MTKSRKKQHRLNKPRIPTQPELPPVQVASKENKFEKIFNKTNLIITFVVSVLSLVAFYFTFPDFFLSQKEKYRRDTFVEGVLRPPVLLNNQRLPYTIDEKSISNFNIHTIGDTPQIKGIYIKGLDKRGFVHVFVSGFVFTCLKEDLERGIDIFNPLFKDCAGQSLILLVKNSRLYISAEFKDLQKEETIGKMEFNHWEIYRPNMYDYDNTDEKLELRDKQSHIVFSINFEDIGLINISGYFIGNSSIIVMPNDPKKSKSINPLCLYKGDPNWKLKAIYEIEKIESIFPEKYKPK